MQPTIQEMTALPSRSHHLLKIKKLANYVKKQMQILSAYIGVQIRPVFHFQTREIGQILTLNSECAQTSSIFKIWREQPKNKFCSYPHVG